MHPFFKAHLALFVANLIYGINYSVAKDVMPGYMLPSALVVLRVSGALLLFWLAARFFTSEKVHKKDLLKLAACGLFGVAVNQMLFLKGLNITTPINASIIMTSNPILVLIAAGIILKESITRRRVAGIMLGLSGSVTLLLFNGDFSIGSSTLPGDLMVLLNATSYGIYLILIKPLMEKYQPITVIKWVFLFGFIYVIPFGYEEFMAVNWASFPQRIWMEVLFVVLGTTFIAYFLNVFALKRLSPAVVSFYLYLQPVFATMIALFYGMDEPDWIKAVSALLIFAGVYLISKPAGR